MKTPVKLSTDQKKPSQTFLFVKYIKNTALLAKTVNWNLRMVMI